MFIQSWLAVSLIPVSVLTPPCQYRQGGDDFLKKVSNCQNIKLLLEQVKWSHKPSRKQLTSLAARTELADYCS